MSAWTNGDVHVVLGPRGLSLHRGDHAELVLALAQIGEFPPRKKVARMRPLAVDPAAKVAFTVNQERGLIRTTLEVGGKALLYPWQISAMAPIDHERVLAAYVTGTKARALTSVVYGAPPPDPKAKWEREFESDKPKKVDWPDNLIWDKPIWSRKTRWTTDPDLLEIDGNRHGFVLTDTDSAVVGLLRPDPSGFVCILRTPKDKDSTVAATATAQGVLVATGMPSLNRSVICHFDESGALLFRREFEARELGPITIVDDLVVCVVERREVLLLGLDDLAPRTKVALGSELPPTQMTMRGSSKRSFVLAGAGRVFQGRHAEAQWSVIELDLSRVPEPSGAHEAAIAIAEIAVPEPSEAAASAPIDLGLRIIGQAPQLGLDPHQANEAWHYKFPEPFEIEIKAVSIGGPAETGLYVELSGDAIEKKIFEPLSVRASGTVGDLQAGFPAGAKKRTAVLDYRVPAGVEPPKDKKIKPLERFAENPPDTFLTLRLACKPLVLGTGLLYVRVGFDRAGNEGSLMRGRQLTISETGPVAPPPPPPEPPPAAAPVDDPDEKEPFTSVGE
ncbi:hypothetical protein ACNOYE_29710 [Nannocystaceae bacterium ST9]